MAAQIKFQNVTLGYDRHPAVHHLNGEVATGALVAVIGPNWMNLLSARMAAGGKDLMREEIATALGRNLIVIPILIDRALPPHADTLPDDIRALVAHETEED